MSMQMRDNPPQAGNKKPTKPKENKKGDKIPELRTWFTGRNISTRPIAFDYALVADVDDQEALQRYLVNPDHQAGVKLWAEISNWNIADIEY